VRRILARRRKGAGRNPECNQTSHKWAKVSPLSLNCAKVESTQLGGGSTKNRDGTIRTTTSSSRKWGASVGTDLKRGSLIKVRGRKKAVG